MFNHAEIFHLACLPENENPILRVCKLSAYFRMSNQFPKCINIKNNFNLNSVYVIEFITQF